MNDTSGSWIDYNQRGVYGMIGYIELIGNLRNVNLLFNQTIQFIKNVPDKILRSLSVLLLQGFHCKLGNQDCVVYLVS